MSDCRCAGTSILVVEDDADAADLQLRLISFGHSALLVRCAEDAMATLAAWSVDLILLNLLLPDCDGLVLCSRLRSRTSAPIIMLSARVREVDRVLALESGATDFLNKPVDFDDLWARIEALIIDRRYFEPPRHARATCGVHDRRGV
jgi:DNA-binding response OmpR family regulator